jgi:hypothetical protein
MVDSHVEGPQCPGYNWATLFLWDICGGLEPQMKQQNKVVSSAELGLESDCSGKAEKQLYE